MGKAKGLVTVAMMKIYSLALTMGLKVGVGVGALEIQVKATRIRRDKHVWTKYPTTMAAGVVPVLQRPRGARTLERSGTSCVVLKRKYKHFHRHFCNSRALGFLGCVRVRAPSPPSSV